MSEEMEELGLLKEAFESIDPRCWVGLAVVIVVFAFEVILMKKGIIFAKEEKIMKQVKEAGHCIPAKQVNCMFDDRKQVGKYTEYIYTATYEYTVNGKTRTKIIVSNQEPPSEITLYYVKTPKKVFSDYDCLTSRFVMVIYIIPMLAAALVMYLLGFNVG